MKRYKQNMFLLIVLPSWGLFFVKTIYDKFIKKNEAVQNDESTKQEEQELNESIRNPHEIA